MTTRRCCLAAFGLLAALCAAPVSAQSIYSVTKSQNFIQRGPASVVPDGTAPFTFVASAKVTGVTVRTPDGATFPLTSPNNDQGFSYARSFATKAELDAAFPNGTYTLSGPGIPTLTFVLTGDLYPVTPQLTGGNWNQGGALLLAPAVATTLSFNTFSTYSTAGALGHIYLEFGPDVDQDTVSRAVPGVPVTVAAQPVTTLAVPGTALRANSVVDGGIEFDTFLSLDTTSIAGAVVIAGYGSHTRFFVAAVSTGAGGNPPVLTTQPANVGVAPGGRAVFNVAVNNGTAPGPGTLFDWRFNGESVRLDNNPKYSLAPNGSLTVNNVTAADAGNYAVRIANTGGIVVSNVVTLSLVTGAPVITTPPAAQNAVLGGVAVFSVGTANAGNSYQWRKDDRVIDGATSATLILTGISNASAGLYSVVVSNSLGSTPSPQVPLVLVPANQGGRLINLSILTTVAAGGDSFTMGYVVGGSGTSGAKPLVIRVAGPSLAQLGVTGSLDDPKLELFAGSTKTGENDNWGGGVELRDAMASVGAFAFSGPTSRDAAASVNITSSDNSVRVSAVGSGSGTVIAELYEATPPATFTTSTPRLVNVSVLKSIGSGLTAGFYIGGVTAKTVLIRAVGPTLAGAPFNVTGVVADPQLALFSGQAKIGENNDWGGSPALAAAFAQVGAFTLPTASRDAAILATLNPGSYTVQVSPTGTATGVALVEVYEVP